MCDTLCSDMLRDCSCAGTSTPYTPGTKVFFAELLESMMPKFVEKVHALGFQKCARIPGTWKASGVGRA